VRTLSRSLAIGLLVLLTVLSAGSAWAANLLVARLVAVDEPVPEIDGEKVVATSSPSPGAARSRALTQDQYIDGIMSRNLLDITVIETWAPPAAGGGPGVARSELRVKLLGTMVADPAELSIAMIADESTPDLPSSYGIGDTLHDRKVVSIEHERVGLEFEGKIEYLTMDDGQLSTAVASSDGTETPTGEGVSQIAENKFAVDRTLFDKYISDPEGIAGLGRALLHRGPDGEYDGYRLSAIRRNTLADQLGIKNGDIIHSVNGQPLNSMQSAMGAYNTMKTESSFCFEISRRGSPQQLCYEVR
jgi:general secretion pathway protein C